MDNPSIESLCGDFSDMGSFTEVAGGMDEVLRRAY